MKRAMTAAESRWVTQCVELGCVVCKQPAQWHHCRGGSYTRVYGIVGGAGKAPHTHGIPLCERHHTGADGIHKCVEVWELMHGQQVAHMNRLVELFGERPDPKERKSRNRRPSKIVPRGEQMA